MTTRSRTTLLIAVASAMLPAPLASAAPTPRCAEAAQSALAEPDWYLEDCLGGVPPVSSEQAPPPSFAFGDLFYLHNIRAAGQFPLSVYTTGSFASYTLLGPNALPIFAMDFDLPATTLWGIDNTSRALGTYSLTTGAFTQTAVISGIPVADTISGLKFDPTSNTVYVSTTIALWILDTATGAATLVGPYTHASAAVIDIAIGNTGQVFGEDLNDNFYRIDKTTGATTLIGPMGVNINFAQGMDFDWSDDTLYQFAYLGGGVNHLRRIDLATGLSTQLVNPPNGPEHEGAVNVPSTPAVTVAPIANAVDPAGNDVLEPNEVATMAPTWLNTGAAAVSLTGVLSNFTGPTGPAYNLVDGAAAYGTIAPLTNADCGTNCYSLSISSATRPATHWDASALETANPGATTKTWLVHVGGSFADVAASSPFYRFVETILHKPVTGGCTATTYCPSASTTREQMAVFVLVSKEAPGYSPAACGATPMFDDVPASSPFCRWIEELARRQVVSGCGGGNYCPTASATREAMAVFVLRTLDPALNPPPCGATPMFDDVPASSPFCRWIEELARRQVVTGCGGGNYCPTADVSREQMSVFLAVTFGLTLYAP